MTIALLAVFAIKVMSVIDTTTTSTESDIEQTRIDAQSRHVLRQIGFAIMGSHPQSLDPNMPAPLNQSSIKYHVNLGVSNGEVVWTDPEMVALEDGELVAASKEQGGLNATIDPQLLARATFDQADDFDQLESGSGDGQSKIGEELGGNVPM